MPEVDCTATITRTRPQAPLGQRISRKRTDSAVKPAETWVPPDDDPPPPGSAVQGTLDVDQDQAEFTWYVSFIPRAVFRAELSQGREVDTTTFATFVVPGADFGPVVEEQALLESQIHRDLEDTVEAARTEGEAIPQKAAIETCKRVAKLVIPHLVGHENLRLAAFYDEDGAVCLVLQPVGVRRRLTFEVSADGRRVEQVRIDESLKIQRTLFSIGTSVDVAEPVRWLIGRS